MTFSATEKGNFLVVTCPDTLDSTAAKQIKIYQPTWIEKAKDIALDFRAVETITPDCFRALSTLAKAAKDANLKVVTFNPNKKILAEIKSEGLENMLNPVNT